MALLSVQQLTLSIEQRVLCRDLSLEIRTGENWAVLGANGAGKTTLLHTFAGLKTPASGHVLLNAQEIGQLPARERARQLGVLFQDYEAAFPATVLETVLTGRHPHLTRWQWEDTEDIRRAETALDTVGLSGFTHRHVSTLSGGERRRVEIATLLVQDAPVNLMDEPTNHLDLRHQVRMLELLAARVQQPGHANVFVLHDVNLALHFCDHGVLLFDDGASKHGPLSELLQRDTLERLYRCRLREINDGHSRIFLPT